MESKQKSFIVIIKYIYILVNWFIKISQAWKLVKRIVIRAKGIFHLEDSNIIYADFIDGVPSIDFLHLNVQRYLNYEPKCFSGLEIVGFSLNEVALQRIIKKISLPLLK